MAVAQPPDRVSSHQAHAWFMFFGDHAVRGPWGVHLEGQWRRHDLAAKWQQLLLRPGVNFEVNRRLMLTLGYAFVDTFRYGEFPVAYRFPEHRLFQQALLRQPAGKLHLTHRYRLEQRLLGEMLPAAGGGTTVANWRHENRFRYMVRGTVPFRGDSIVKGSWYFAGYNELFVNFGKNVANNVFDQNRAYAALGRDLGPPGRLEFGYLHQLLQQRSGRVLEHNHTLQVALYSTLPFRWRREKPAATRQP